MWWVFFIELTYIIGWRVKIWAQQGITRSFLAKYVRICPADFFKMADAMWNLRHDAKIFGMWSLHRNFFLWGGFFLYNGKRLFHSDFAHWTEEMMGFGSAHIIFNKCWVLSSCVSDLCLKALTQLRNISIFAKSISPLEKGNLMVNFALFEISIQKFAS